MKKLIIIIAGIVVISGLVIVGYNLGNNSNSENLESTTKNSSQKNQKSEYSLSKCQNIKSEVIRTSCYIEIAVSKGDPSICKNLNDYVLGMNGCYNEVAQNKKDESICMMIKEQHPQAICLGKIGKQKNDPSVCENLETDIWKNQCKAMVNE